MTDSFGNPPSDAGPHLTQVDEEPTNYGRLAIRVIGALIISALAVVAWISFERKTPFATGAVTHLSIFPVQAKITGGAAGTPGMTGQDEIIDQLMVFAQVHLTNPNSNPITIEDDWGVVTLPNGETRRSLGASASDFDKVFLAYPQLASVRAEPLRRDMQLAPGQSVDGLVIFSYPLSRDQWDSRKSMQVTVSFNNAKDITLDVPKN